MRTTSAACAALPRNTVERIQNIMKTLATRKTLYGMVTAVALSAMLVVPAMAQDTTTAVVTAGTLSITAAVPVDNFVGRNITGAAQTTTATMDPYTVSDLRGSGAGWHVTAVASQFTTAGGALAVGSLLSSAWTVESLATNSPDPTGMTAQVLDNGAKTIATAALEAGMGRYNFSNNLFTLSLPADVKAGTYSSTVTVSVTTAP